MTADDWKPPPGMVKRECRRCHKPFASRGDAMCPTQPIATAPKDGSRIIGRQGAQERETFWCKNSHIPIYGWNVQRDPDEEDLDPWHPTHWRPKALAAPGQ